MLEERLLDVFTPLDLGMEKPSEITGKPNHMCISG